MALMHVSNHRRQLRLTMKDSWIEIIPNEIWTCENFLQDSMIERMLQEMETASEKTLDGGDAKHLVGNTYYNYNVVNSMRSNTEYKNAVIDRLNILYQDVFGKTASKENLSALNYFFKTFNPNTSKYDLHTESPELFGDAVFMLYLSDEQDGALKIPSKIQCDDIMTEGFKEMMEKVDVRFAGPLSIKPKKNKCVVMRVGLAHLVEPCSGQRPCVTGWSFASKEYMEKYNG